MLHAPFHYPLKPAWSVSNTNQGAIAPHVLQIAANADRPLAAMLPLTFAVLSVLAA